MTWLTVNVDVNLCLLFSTDLLHDYENNQNPLPGNIDAFLVAVTQPNGPVAAAFNYLNAQPGCLPNNVVG